jgi:hypothetical protein
MTALKEPFPTGKKSLATIPSLNESPLGFVGIAKVPNHHNHAKSGTHICKENGSGTEKLTIQAIRLNLSHRFINAPFSDVSSWKVGN